MDVYGWRDYEVAVFGGEKKMISASAFNLLTPSSHMNSGSQHEFN
jgi:hypothetical protein